MRASVKTSVNGRPSLRAKRARTAFRLVIGSAAASRVVGVRGSRAAARVAVASRSHSLFFAEVVAERIAYASAIRRSVVEGDGQGVTAPGERLLPANLLAGHRRPG